MSNKTVIMLMSGGVDSSVAAYLLKQQNYRVVGLHFKTVSDFVFSLIPEKKKVCCSPSDTQDAIKTAKKLELDDFQIVDIKEDFKEKIINYFINTYEEGKTPNPCMLCNRFFKFGKAIEIANKYGADWVSSGHYLINEYSEKYSTYIIKKGVDQYKDQSYFLSYINKNSLPKLYFPLGNMYKVEIREIAKKIGLSVANKPDSQELCFIPDNDYRRFLKEYGVNPGEGKVYDLDGNEIGLHKGYTNYTIGQRSGISYYKNVSVKLHVFKIIPKENILIVAPTEKMYSKELSVKNVNFFIDFDEIEALCRIRKKSEEKPAVVKKITDNTLKVSFKEPIFAVTPGQFATIYDENGVILASGVIDI